MDKMVKRVAPLLLLGLLGCDARPTVYRAESPGKHDQPRTVAVRQAVVGLGFAKGVLRKSIKVDGFRISRHPTTVGQFRACVKAGACHAPKTGVTVQGWAGLQQANA